MMAVQTTLLSDVLESAVSGFASGANDASGVAQVRMNNIETDGSWNWSSIRRVPKEAAKDRYYLQAGDVLFNATNSPNLVGKSAYFSGFDEPMVFSNHFVRLRTSPSILDGRYLARWLNLLWKQRLFETRCTQWVNQATYRKDDLLSLEIPLPPLPEQKRIAAILDAADALRARRRTALAELDALLQSTFLDMFGDPVTNPMGWEATSLGKTVPAINVGHVGPTSHGYVEDGEGVTFLRTQNVRRNKLDLTDVRYISDEFADQLRKSRLRPGDVLVSRVGANRGMAAVVPNALDGANCANIVIVRSSPKLVPTYLAELINGPYGERTLIGNSVGAAQGVINVGTLDRWSVLLPPIDLQNRFAAAVKAIELQKERMYNHLAELDALFASLQSRAFNGEL